MTVFCLFTLGRHGNFTTEVTLEQPDLLCTVLALNIQKYFTSRVHNVTPPEKNVLRLPITLLIFIIMLLNLDTIISKI
jgi:hypothetical protein